MKNYIFIILFIFCLNSFSQTIISGDVSGMIFRSTGNPWIVQENISIPYNGTAIVKSGCIFLFKPFTGVIVNGSFLVEGKPENPVVFTSINNDEAIMQNPEPFDWNGVLIEKTAQTVNLSNFLIAYSVYGLKSKKENITIKKGIFRQNGQFHFTINDKIQEVLSDIPYNYSLSNKKSSSKIKNKPLNKEFIGISSITAGTILMGIMTYFINSSSEFNEKYNNAETIKDIEYYSKKRDGAVGGAWITGIMGGVITPVGLGMILWENKIGKKMSLYTTYGKINNVTIVLDF
jgi:hypothetical protein